MSHSNSQFYCNSVLAAVCVATLAEMVTRGAGAQYWVVGASIVLGALLLQFAQSMLYELCEDRREFRVCHRRGRALTAFGFAMAFVAFALITAGYAMTLAVSAQPPSAANVWDVALAFTALVITCIAYHVSISQYRAAGSGVPVLEAMRCTYPHRG